MRILEKVFVWKGSGHFKRTPLRKPISLARIVAVVIGVLALSAPIYADDGLLPTSDVRILRIEAPIEALQVSPSEVIRMSVEVYGRQDIRDDSLGDKAEVSFEWQAVNRVSESLHMVGEFREAVIGGRDRNGVADDRRVNYAAPADAGRYRITVALDAGEECIPKREGETDEDEIARCSAVFDLDVRRLLPEVADPDPPKNPPGPLPAVIVDDAGTNYEVFTPEGGGSFATEHCSFSVPPGAVGNGEVIGVSATDISSDDEKTAVVDSRYATGGLECRVNAVDVNGDRLDDYLLTLPGEACIPLPDSFRSKVVETFVGAVNRDGTLTALSSKTFLSSPQGQLTICGSLSSLSATITAASRAEVTGEVPPTPAATPEISEINTGGGGLDGYDLAILLLVGTVSLAFGGFLIARRRLMRRT